MPRRKAPHILAAEAKALARWRRRQLAVREPARHAPRRQPPPKTISRANTSGYKGVSTYRGRWQAAICANGQRVHLGIFNSAREAALAYDAKARELKGPRAVTNASLGLLRPASGSGVAA